MPNVIEEICKWCEKEVRPHNFPDYQSYKEYQISGLCWDCQNATFDDHIKYTTKEEIEKKSQKKV